jgi:hypothetical protein
VQHEVESQGIATTQKFKTQLSAVKIVVSVFWNSKREIHVDFLPHGVTINAQYYSNLLHNGVHQTLWMKRPTVLSKVIILLHDDANPHTSNVTKTILATMGREVMNHTPCSPDLATSGFYLFEPIKMYLEEQKFQTDDELKYGALNWLRSQDETFYAADINDLPQQWKKCVSVKGEYPEKE